jgi:WD40 repeat protein
VPEGTLIVEGPQFFRPSAISFSSDGQLLFANDALGAACLWKITGNTAAQIDNVARPGPNAPSSRRLQRGVLSPDGSRLAAMFGRQIVIARTPDIQQQVCSIDREGASSFLTFTPDSRRLLSLEAGRWRLFDAESGAQLADNHPLSFSLLTHCGFDASGTSALVASGTGLDEIDLMTGKVTHALSFLQPMEGYVGAGISDDGSWLIATAADRVDIWDARSKAKTGTWSVTQQHHSPLITSDGKFAILKDQTQLFVWDVAAKKQVAAWDVQGLNLGMPLLADRAGKVAAFSQSGTQVRVFSLPR